MQEVLDDLQMPRTMILPQADAVLQQAEQAVLAMLQQQIMWPPPGQQQPGQPGQQQGQPQQPGQNPYNQQEQAQAQGQQQGPPQ
jgi:hypothetical protein